MLLVTQLCLFLSLFNLQAEEWTQKPHSSDTKLIGKPATQPGKQYRKDELEYDMHLQGEEDIRTQKEKEHVNDIDGIGRLTQVCKRFAGAIQVSIA